MTNYTQIYFDSHTFGDGIIEIDNVTANLSKAYIAVNTIDLQEKLEQPLLLGFLYQVDGDKRSRPYPIVSQRQSVPLDFSTCDRFLFVPTNYLISQYSLGLWVSTESGGGASVDLANYALISQLPDLTNYALKSEIPTVPSLTGYALTSQLPDLTSYALKSEIPTQNFISLSANQTLERNKNYFANTSGLICSLPSALSVGDIVNLATGNYTFRVNHGNSSQLILNLSTQSTVGADNGIILKAYSSVQLMFVGSNLWVTNFRSRTINNWVVPAVEATAGIKPYAASALEAYTYYTGYELNKINDGSISIGTLKTGGGTPFEFRVLITFAASTILTSLNYWLGQFNGAFNFPSSVDIYLGAILDPLNKIATLSFVGSSGSLSVPNTNQSTQYVLNFKSTTSSMNTAIQEIQAVGRQVVGGELMVV